MPIFSVRERCEWRPTSCTDFVTWWLLEFLAAAGCVFAGLLLWGPLAAVAVLPLFCPLVHLAYLPALMRQHAERQRARIAAAEQAERERIAAAMPVPARAERLDLPQLTEAER